MYSQRLSRHVPPSIQEGYAHDVTVVLEDKRSENAPAPPRDPFADSGHSLFALSHTILPIFILLSLSLSIYLSIYLQTLLLDSGGVAPAGPRQTAAPPRAAPPPAAPTSTAGPTISSLAGGDQFMVQCRFAGSPPQKFVFTSSSTLSELFQRCRSHLGVQRIEITQAFPKVVFNEIADGSKTLLQLQLKNAAVVVRTL